MRKRFFAVSLGLLLGLTGCTSEVVQDTTDQTSGQAIEQASTNKADEDSITYTGSIQPTSQIQVFPKMTGTIMKVDVDLGSQVEAGDVLCELDDTDAKLQLQQAQAAYDSAVANADKTTNGTDAQTTMQLSQAVDKAKTDADTAQTNYDQAKANYDAHTKVNQAQLTLDDATNVYNNAKTSLDNDTTITAAQTAYDSANADYERTKTLFDSGIATQKEMDDASARLTDAKASLDTAQTNANQTVQSDEIKVEEAQQALDDAKLNEKNDLTNAQANLDKANQALKAANDSLAMTNNVINPENEKTAQASIDSAKAALDLAQNQLDNTIVKAPISGSISNKVADEGMLASPQTALFTLVNQDTVNIQLQVNQSDIGYMTAGKDVEISVENTDIENMEGKISEVSPSADLQTGMFTVNISVDNPQQILKGGMFADVTIAKK